MLRNRNSILLKFSNEFIREHKFPLPLSLFFETISSFQIIGCILQASFPSDSRTTSIAFNIFQYFIALPGVFSDWNVLITTKIFNLIWFSCIAYLICYGVLLLIIFIGTVLHIKSNYLAKFLTLLSLAHSRLFYYPIFYLFLQTIRNCIDNPESKTFLTIGSTPAFIISVIFAGVSLAFSLFKEFLCYRINKDKSTYSSKNNLYYQLVLTVKTAILAVYVLSSASNEAASYAVGILSIVYSIIALYFLYNKLPFYNLTLMQYSFLLTSSTFAVSIFALISIGDPKEKTIRSLTFIFVIFCVRFLYARLVRLFEEILGGVFDTPERAIHFPILLKKYTSKNDGLISVNEEFPYESLYFYSFSGVKMNDPNRPPDMKVSDFMHKDFYSMFLKKCSEERINYKKSEVFLLYLAKSFIKKSRNTFQALNLMEEVQSMSSSIPVRNSVDNFYSKIRGTYEKMIHQSAASLELSYYFHCRDELAIIKKDMQAEIKLHLEFWKEISGDNVNVKRIIDISENINSVHSRIKKCWKKNEHNFPKVYLSSLILYGLYFDFIRGMPQESIPIIRKFYTHHKSNSFKNKSELISSTSAVIVASLEKEKLGVVTDASDTVMTLFNIAKDRFVGMKINSIMPDFIGKQHDRYMQKYSQDSKSHELDRKIHSYAKTLKGEIMELDINLKIYPYLDKGINLMGYVQKNAEETQMIIVNSDGTIVESSPSLIKTLRLASSGLTLKKINLQDICPKFEKINSAFNTYYQKDIQPHFGAYEESFITMKSPTGANNYQNPFFSKGTYLPFQSSVTYFTEKGNKDDENPLMMFGSPPQSPDALRNPLASPGVFHSPTTLPNFYESGSLAKGPFTQGETRTKTLLSKEEAEEICKKYEERGNLRFFTYDQGIRKSVTEYKKDGVMINVSIKPYIFEGNVYKVVKLIDIHSRKGIDLVETSSLNLLPKQNSKLTKSEDEIEEESSDIDRSETPSKAINDNTGIITIPDEREPEFGGRDKRKDVSLLFKLQKIEDDEIQSPGESKPKTLNMEQQSQANLEGGVQVKLLYQQLGGALKSKKLENEEELMPVKENFQNIDLRNSVTGAGSSTASFSHMDLKLIKKLTDVFEVRRIRPLTKVSIFGVYFVMIAVLVLTFVNFAITQKSLKQNESGADILNTLGTRLSNTVVAWEWLLMFYSRLLGLRPLFSVYGYSRQVIYNSTLTTEELNGDLMTMLGSLDNEDIVNQVLAKNIKFYNADRTLLYSDELLDSFSASNLLILQNFFIGKYSGLDAVLVKRPEFITLSNNTANDYLVSCEAQIKQVFNTLQTISNNNITQSEKILIFENIALIALYISLVFVGRVVTQSFAKTFQALIKIKKTSVTERIKHIKTFETLLNENLEGQSYPRNFDAYLNGLTSKAIVHEPAKQKNTGTGHFSKNYVLKDLVMHIFKFNLASIILILIISGMFLALYLQSQSSFTSLNRQTEQLYMINKVSYESALVVANFYYVVIYQNDTSMLIRNEQPLTQLAKNLEVFSEVNEQLLAAYGSTADKDMDPVIREIFEGSICEFTKASIASNCEIASQGYTLGLLGINSFAMTTSTNYINAYLKNPTTENAKTLLVPYYDIGVSFDMVYQSIYDFLITYTADNLHSEVSSLRKSNLVLSWGAVLFIIISTFAIQAISIQKFINLDNSQRKIFRVVTYRVFTQNKILGFLLKKQFKSETEGLNRILSV